MEVSNLPLGEYCRTVRYSMCAPYYYEDTDETADSQSNFQQQQTLFLKGNLVQFSSAMSTHYPLRSSTMRTSTPSGVVK